MNAVEMLLDLTEKGADLKDKYKLGDSPRVSFKKGGPNPHTPRKHVGPVQLSDQRTVVSDTYAALSRAAKLREQMMLLVDG